MNKDELALLGKLPDTEFAKLTGCTFATVWEKRRASLHLDSPHCRDNKRAVH